MIAANLDLRDPCHGPRGGRFGADEVDAELGLKSPHSVNSVHVAAAQSHDRHQSKRPRRNSRFPDAQAGKAMLINKDSNIKAESV